MSTSRLDNMYASSCTLYFAVPLIHFIILIHGDRYWPIYFTHVRYTQLTTNNFGTLTITSADDGFYGILLSLKNCNWSEESMATLYNAFSLPGATGGDVKQFSWRLGISVQMVWTTSFASHILPTTWMIYRWWCPCLQCIYYTACTWPRLPREMSHPGEEMPKSTFMRALTWVRYFTGSNPVGWRRWHASIWNAMPKVAKKFSFLEINVKCIKGKNAVK